MDIQTYRSPCGVLLSVFGNFFFSRSSSISSSICKMSKMFFCGLHFYFAKTNFSYARPPIFPPNFPALKRDSATARFTGWSTIFEMLTSRVTFDLNSSTWPLVSPMRARPRVENALALCFPRTRNAHRSEAEGNIVGRGKTKLTVSRGTSH